MKRFFYLFVFLYTCTLSYSEEIDLNDFTFLMGNKTSFWKNLKTKQDLLFFQECETIYKKNLPLLSTSLADAPRIPHVVHFIWLGPRSFPPHSVETIRSWVSLHPDWTFKFWTDRPRPLPCQNMQLCLVQEFSFEKLSSYYEKADNWGAKSDILRYEILLQEGGVYADHDAYCLRNCTDLHAGYDLYAGLQVPRDPADFAEGYGITVATGLIGSIPNHPILHMCIDLLIDRWGNKSFPTTFEQVIYNSYIPFTLAVHKLLNRPNHRDIILPASYFYAQETLPALYSRHFFATSWDQKEENTEGSTVKFFNSFSKVKGILKRSIFFGLLACIILGISSLVRKKYFSLMTIGLLLTISKEAHALESFKTLMGEQDPSIWSHVCTPEDKNRLSEFDTLYTKNVDKDLKKPLPKKIHLIWPFPGKIPSSVFTSIKTWKKHHRSWEVKIWRGNENLNLGQLEPLYRRGSFMERSIILKIAILEKEGGIALQADTTCLQSLRPFLPYDFFASLALPSTSFLSSSIFPSPSILGSTASHPIIRIWKEKILKNKASYGHFYEGDSDLTAQTRIAYLFTAALDEAIQEELTNSSYHNIVLPAGYFHQIGNKKALFAKEKIDSTWYAVGPTKFLSKMWSTELLHHARFIFNLSIALCLAAFGLLLYTCIRFIRKKRKSSAS